MTRKVSRIMAVVSASLLTAVAGHAMAEELADDAANARAVMAVDPASSLLPKRWCIESRMTTPSLETVFESRHAAGKRPFPDNFDAYDYRLAEEFTNNPALSYRFAELDSRRLVTFWRGNSLGVFLGITKGGFLSLSIAQ